MKKLILLLMILTLGVGFHLQAAKPIPSYKQLIAKAANFQEKHNNNAPQYDQKGKRYMIIVAQVAGPTKTPISITVYSLDMRDIMGPYILYGGGQITVPIDDRNWGTVIQCPDKVEVSVWIDAGNKGGSGLGGAIYW